MKMKSLLDDFKKYVDAMDEQEIKENIANAIEHTSNSYILDGQTGDIRSDYVDSSVQKISPSYRSKKKYGFCSVDELLNSSMSFEVSERRDWAA